ncbi:MAG TPA: chloride channel protein [Alphaproteobacteria bacterium]|nr:chloride channel protein [Alphaproteobacteria bacterium]
MPRLLVRLRRFRRNNQVVLAVMAVVLGVSAAYGAIGFRYLIAFVQWGAFATDAEQLLGGLNDLPAWRIVLAPVVGGLVVGLFLRYATHDKRSLGVADVIEAAALHGGRMHLTRALQGAFVNAASIGAGASTGREGPVVHLGASIAAWFAKRFNLPRASALTLLGCGVAAAVAASFNAPLAGVFFALEVVVGHYALSAFAPIVIASVIGTMISRAHYGDFPAFIMPGTLTVSAWEFGIFAILGIASAGVAFLFMRSIFNMQNLAAKIPGPVWAKPAYAGLVLGLIALLFPQVLGVGYGVTDQAIRGLLTFELLISLLFIKIFATALCIGFGFGGGVFSPSLVVGAMLGGVFGAAAAAIAPVPASGIGVYSIVGMGAVAGAVLGAPISTVLIVFELTGDYKVTIAVMVAVALASIILQQFGGRSFFHWQLKRRGVKFAGGREHDHLRAMPARRVMVREFATVGPGTHLAELRRRIARAPHGVLFVVDGDERLMGIIALSDMSDALFDHSLDKLIKANDLVRTPRTVLSQNNTLYEAMGAFGPAGDPYLAVVTDKETMRLVGVLLERDFMLAQQRAMLKARAEERGEI